MFCNNLCGKKEQIHVYVLLTHFAINLNRMQCCKSTMPQLNFLKKIAQILWKYVGWYMIQATRDYKTPQETAGLLLSLCGNARKAINEAFDALKLLPAPCGQRPKNGRLELSVCRLLSRFLFRGLQLEASTPSFAGSIKEACGQEPRRKKTPPPFLEERKPIFTKEAFFKGYTWKRKERRGREPNITVPVKSLGIYCSASPRQHCTWTIFPNVREKEQRKHTYSYATRKSPGQEKGLSTSKLAQALLEKSLLQPHKTSGGAAKGEGSKEISQQRFFQRCQHRCELPFLTLSRLIIITGFLFLKKQKEE